jgi:DNA-binding transcriptional ArsR family regulator
MVGSHKIRLMNIANTESAAASASDTLFKAIAHPARRRILTLLAASDRTVKELTSCFDMSQPAISQHLRELREARLVASSKVGSEQRYRLTGTPLKVVYDWCSQYRGFFDPAGHAWAFTSTRKRSAPPATKGSKRGC